MGALAGVPPAERAATLELARALLAAVTNDESWPAPFTAMGRSPNAADTVAVFRLAQDLTLATAELMATAELSRFRAAMARQSAFRGVVLCCGHATCLASIDVVLVADSAWSIDARCWWFCPQHIDAVMEGTP